MHVGITQLQKLICALVTRTACTHLPFDSCDLSCCGPPHADLGRLVLEALRVDAVPLVCGRVKAFPLEHVAQVPAAIGARDLDPTP